jgi:hypothetical protein
MLVWFSIGESDPCGPRIGKPNADTGKCLKGRIVVQKWPGTTQMKMNDVQ